ncbi:hypothetical protein HY251_16005 [bacterium]|nr:hypothetical protein [bacterium]
MPERTGEGTDGRLEDGQDDHAPDPIACEDDVGSSLMRRAAAIVIALWFPCLGATLADDGAKTALDEEIRKVLPRPEEERWLEVPWRSDLALARFEANEQGKPIFLWLMDGDPLGCT